MMKSFFQWAITFCLVIAGIALLANPAHAAGFTPTRFTVTDSGTTGKPDVVLIPGLTSSSAVWDVEAKKLAPNYRLHILQVGGFAGAPTGPNATGTALLPGIVEELHQYIAASKMHPVVIGHSLGGLMTLMLADKYPQDPSKIVIVDSLPFFGMLFGPTATPEMIQPQAAAMRDMLLHQTSEERKAAAAKTAETLCNSPDGRKLVEKNSEDSDVKVFVEAMYEDLQTDVRADLPNIKVKALMLYPVDPAMGDTSSVDAMYQGAYKSMPNVQLVRIDGSRHFIMYDQPEKMDAAFEAFLK